MHEDMAHEERVVGDQVEVESGLQFSGNPREQPTQGNGYSDDVCGHSEEELIPSDAESVRAKNPGYRGRRSHRAECWRPMKRANRRIAHAYATATAINDMPIPYAHCHRANVSDAPTIGTTGPWVGIMYHRSDGPTPRT